MGAEALQRLDVAIGFGHLVGDREELVDDVRDVAKSELDCEPAQRPVGDLDVPVEVGEHDAVDRRVEHGAQEARKSFEILCLAVELLTFGLDRPGHRVEVARELADLVVGALGDALGEVAGGKALRRRSDATDGLDDAL